MTPDEIRHLFTYTEWANARVLDAAERLSIDDLVRDVGISHTSILGTLLHMAGAEWIWLERWHGHSPLGDTAWLPWAPDAAGTIQEVRDKWQPILQKRQALLATVTEADLAHPLTFRRFNGDLHSMPLGQQMQHVVNHATLHRGQVVGMIRQVGVVPPATDLLFYLFETGSGSGEQGAPAALGPR